MEPHSPYNPKKPFVPLPEDLSDERVRYLRKLEYWELRRHAEISPVDHEALLSLYDGMIAEADQLVGELTGELESLGLADRTVIVLLSDHGEEFNEHGGYTHGQGFHHELLRVPLIISGPVVSAPGRVVGTPVRLVDLLPTLSEIAGASVPEEARGRSLLPALQGESIEELPAFGEKLYQVEGNHVVVTFRGFKLIYESRSGNMQLFDLNNDPQENTDISEHQPGKRQELLKLLNEWMAQTAAAARDLPRSTPAEGIDESVEEMIRDAGY
jgi:arylsulfatase A-like enzyme